MAKAKVEKDSSERWLLTYADLMNLLLIFFIIMYALSSADQNKFDALSEALKEELGGPKKASIIELESDKISMQEKAAKEAAAKIKEEKQQKEEKAKEAKAKAEELEKQKDLEDGINQMIKAKNIQGSVEVVREDRGLVVTISENVLFKSGSADINPEFKPTIIAISEILAETYPSQIAIEGHTDTDHIKSAQYPSNWELSSVRATKILRYIVENSQIEPSRISSVGYGEYRPKAPNDTEENKAKNRRVNVVIIDALHGSTMAKPTVENSTKSISPNANEIPK